MFRTMSLVFRWLFLIAIAVFLFFSLTTYGGASLSPNPETGQVWPINDHGQTKYVSRINYAYVQSIPWIAATAVCAGFVAFLIMFARGLQARLK